MADLRHGTEDADLQEGADYMPDQTNDAPLLALLRCEPDLYGKDKFLGGVLAKADGCIYGVPGHAQAILRIDPYVTNETVIARALQAQGPPALQSGCTVF